MPAGAPQGNQNAKKGKRFENALRRALARTGEASMGKGLDKVADSLVKAAVAGEQWACKEIADRIDGKVKQQTEISGPNGNPVQVQQWVLQPVKPVSEDGNG